MTMNLKDSLRKYFDEEMKVDSALKQKYDSQKIDECESYVIGEAKKYLHSQSGAIEDVTVFKWARDFYLDEKASELSEKAKEVIQNEKKDENKTVNQLGKSPEKKDSKKKKIELDEQFFDFGE